MSVHVFSIYDAIYRNARMYGERVALVDESQTVTHEDFLENVDRLAAGLLARGLKKGDRIAVIGRSCVQYVYLYGATARIGAILVPINWRLKPVEIQQLITDCTPSVLVVDEEFKSAVNRVLSADLPVPVIMALRAHAGDFCSLDELIREVAPGSVPEVSDEDPYLIIYTAAVDGRYRGAVLSQRNLLLASWQLASAWRLSESDVNLAMLPLFHVAGPLLFLSALGVGGANVLLSGFEANQALQAIADHKVTMFAEFPPILKTLLENARGKEDWFTSIRHALGLDHPETVKSFQDASGATFWAIYGQTETAGLVTMTPFFAVPGSAGRAIPLVQVQIEDDQGNIVPYDGSGEIVATGPSIFKGYWNLEGDTRHTFRFGRHHTGDRGRIDQSGNLWYEGRLPEKELIKPGGENVYPAEVEKVILEHPSIEEASVIGVPDPEWGEAIRAICVLRRGASMAPSELMDFVASRIARYKKPKQVVFVSELPKNSDGTIDRQKVKDYYGGTSSAL